ncbi:uncharacterized protein E0L32_012241 [Thyridium curvatum]|uniref:Sterol regulatory element-binding protein cleavage-activating protein n=1 Tax=Thyridium curvatum TaxID=1093900 RepID=A0A507BEU2_9PEZI|nr:uncharacterized protein E0L32_012241 [Thyridium curvatum]TPX17274.1 hypothetical protein E0L32_012241 [Thyridium curvatum]
MLIYPFPFLYTNDFINGASNLPRHVWTDAQPLDGKVGMEPDVIMRSLWVHGSYMKALDQDVLLGALDLQDALLGPTKNFNPRQQGNRVPPVNASTDLTPSERDMFHVVNGLTNQSWFFHSPLQYWSCDAERISSDGDIVSTVNARKTTPTSVNVTLRHSIVFSGKRFEDRALVAADALVITLLHLRDSPVGRLWERRAEDLAQQMADKWTVIPSDGHIVQSQLYEFQFRPISVQDSILLTVAYALTAMYFMLSLSKLRAMKSKPGLILTVMSQIFASIMSSFTVCAIFKIDLSRIPRAAYPLVVLTMSLENMFRLINAVLVTPAEDSTSSRIGQAFGHTCHVAIASVAQNLLILWGLSKAVSPGVAAFCTFAAIAIVFDFFYLSTFFLSVLSVEVRRTELSEALEKSSRHKMTRSDPLPRQTWAEAIYRGNIGLSTRIAGTIVMSGFILIAQWHFLDNASIYRAVGGLFYNTVTNNTAAAASPLTAVHQARSPTSWLRLQDHETAKEVIQVVKPSAHSYVARVYEPLVFVLKGSDRMPSVTERALLPAVYDFANHQLVRLLVTVLVIVAAVRLFMNYLLWDDMKDSKANEEDLEDGPLMSIKSLNRGHALDIVMLAATPDGQFVSVGLDRRIRVWRLNAEFKSYALRDPENPIDIPFPVHALAIDDDSTWLAVLSSYEVVLWNLVERRRGPSMALDLYGQKPEAFFFNGHAKEDSLPSLIIVRRDGNLMELRPDSEDRHDTNICRQPLVCAIPFSHSSNKANTSALSVLAATRKGNVYKVTQQQGRWVSEEVALSAEGLQAEEKEVSSLVPLPGFSAYLVVRSRSVELVSFATARILHIFRTQCIQARSLRVLLPPKRQTQSGSSGIASMTLAYTNSDTGDCVLQTYLPPQEGGTICFCSSESANKQCCHWSDTREIIKQVEAPGLWVPLQSGCVVGVRKVVEKQVNGSSEPRSPENGMRHRGAHAAKPQTRCFDTWETWSMTQLYGQGDYETTPLAGEDSQHLIISDLGPMISVGSSTVALGLGNIIKLISIGHSRFGTSAKMMDSDSSMSLGSRRRRNRVASRG